MSSENPSPEEPQEQPPAPSVELSTAVQASLTTVAPTGRRQAFRDIRRQLQEAELASPGVQKLLLEDLERAESECDVLQGYVERYHQADKRAAVLEERLRTHTAVEILFGVGISVGSAIIGFVPSLWDASAKGPVALALGVLLVGGASIARIVKR